MRGYLLMAIRVMIVDDAPEQRALLRMRFEQMGCEVVAEVGDAAEAITLFGQLKPELVTLDVIMPEGKGVDALSAFRKMREIVPRARIVIVSAVSWAKSNELFLAEGAFAVVEKPVTRTDFRGLQRRIAAAFPEYPVAPG